MTVFLLLIVVFESFAIVKLDKHSKYIEQRVYSIEKELNIKHMTAKEYHEKLKQQQKENKKKKG